MTEIEYKLVASPKTADAIAASPALAALADGPPCTRRLGTTYHDTANGALAAAGIALRLRHDGRSWVQTVKAGRVTLGGLAEARESEAVMPGPVPDPAAIPDPDLAETVAALIGTAALVPVQSSEITRTVRHLALPGLGRVEMAIDQGEITAGGHSGTLSEIEFELIEGSPHAVFEAVRRVVPAEALVPSTLSKAARGRILAETGTLFPPATPRKSTEVALDPAMTAEHAAHAVLGECLEQIVANVPAIAASDDPEGPHQLRIGLRRLRSALAMVREALSGAEHARLGAEARWLGQEVGRLRDLDVARADLVRPAAAALPDAPGFDALEAALRARGEAERCALRATLAGARVRRFMLDLSAYVACRGWLDPSDWSQTARLARPVPEVAAEALDHRLGAAAKRARGIAKLSTEARHDLRKSLKKLRYTAEFAASLNAEKAVKPFLKRLKALQDVFGSLNDAAMAEALLLAPDAPGAQDPQAARAAGIVIGLHAERARHDWMRARGLWREFRDTRPFWR